MTLWSGRFSEDPDARVWRYTVTPDDRRLLEVDVEGSIAHVGMLHQVGIITEEEHRRLEEGLRRILEEAQNGTFEFFPTDEDVHTAVERRLVELVGEVGEKLHTGRSRNDQVALDIRLHLRRSAASRSEQITRLVGVLADLAETHAEVVVPSYTHLQQAQAVPLGHHLLAHAWALLRDRERFADVRRRLDESPLGAGASAGSTLALDPSEVARRLGFSRVFRNSMDAVASRDLVAEYVWCCAQTMVDLSRLAEEIVLWSGTEFGWVTLPDSFTTGSSALPHKRNPDVAELARGQVGAAVGALVDLLVVQKALPLTYNRDLQQDKQAVFRADDLLAGTLEVLAPMLASARFHPPPPTPSVTALDLAEVLVSRGVPFRQAHRAVGRLVARLENEGRDLGSVTYQDLAGAHPEFRAEDVALADPSESVRRRATPGGGSVDSVREQIRALREILA